MWLKRNSLFVMGMLTLLALAGCGGGSQTPQTSIVTRSSSASFSEDALILAVRETSDGWIRTDTATQRDRDLKRIRERFPQLHNVHAWSDIEMKNLWVFVKRDAAWHRNWTAGELSTGERKLDAQLQIFKVSKIQKSWDLNDYTTFILSFDSPLNIRHVANQFQYASPKITGVSANERVTHGGNDNIQFRQENGTRIYVFTRAWQVRCCTEYGHHLWTVSLHSNGEITVEESGEPLPPTLS